MADYDPKRKIYAYAWFDVEDYVTPESNDVPLKAIKILKKYKVPVTMKLVGEKVRFMREQKRSDVIAAIKGYADVGFHTDAHSRHPIVYQYIATKDVLRGAKEIQKREGRGVVELKRTFGYVPSCFGHAGTQWAPHYYPYMKEQGIPVYLDATDIVNIDDSPYWYCGVLSLNNTDKNYIRFDRSFETADGSEKLKKRFEEIHDRLRRSGGGAISILWHPHTGINKVYWDALNFERGKNTPKGKYIVPEQYPSEIKERALRDFESLVKFGSSFKDVKFISASDAVHVYPRNLETVLPKSDVQKIVRNLSRRKEISFFKLGDGYYSPSQLFCAIVNFVVAFERSGKVPEKIAVSEPLGPLSPFKSKIRKKDVGVASIFSAARRTSEFIASKGYLPSSIKIEKSVELEPSDFLATISGLSMTLLSGKTPGERIPILRARMILSEKYVDEEAFKRALEWKILPKGFSAPKILEQAKLQAWTLVPAIAK